jgi:hypothetical protein
MSRAYLAHFAEGHDCIEIPLPAWTAAIELLEEIDGDLAQLVAHALDFGDPDRQGAALEQLDQRAGVVRRVPPAAVDLVRELPPAAVGLEGLSFAELRAAAREAVESRQFERACEIGREIYRRRHPARATEGNEATAAADVVAHAGART